MLAEIITIDKSLSNKEKLLSFGLLNNFTDGHMIKMVFEDIQRQLAIFVT
jgi:hypothetical protein